MRFVPTRSALAARTLTHARLPALALAVGVAVLLAGWSSAARAYVPSLKEIQRRIANRPEGISRAAIESHTVVFDPFAVPGAPAGAADAPAPEARPVPLPERNFRQRVYWIAQSFLGIQTFDEEGRLLHFLLDEGLRPVSGNLDAARRFLDVDVRPAYLPFLEGGPGAWWQAMADWGIVPRSVELARGPKDAVYVKLVDSPGRALWIERETLRPVRVETLIAGGERPLHLVIEFTDFLTVAEGTSRATDVFYPRTTNYLLDGRLFKQSRIVSFAADPSTRNFPVTALRERARAALQAPALKLKPQEGTQ